MHGAKGLGLEVARGISGIVTVPSRKAKERGVGCVTITKGSCQGLLGLVTFPITGLLKMVHSISTGVKNFTGNEGAN